MPLLSPQYGTSFSRPARPLENSAKPQASTRLLLPQGSTSATAPGYFDGFSAGGISPLPPVAAANLYPFSRKLAVYGRELRNDAYGPANASILLGIAGLGITNGSYMVLLKNLGEEGSSLPVFGFMGLTALSMILSGASKTYTSHQRDNQDLVFDGDIQDITGSQYCQYLVRCGMATAATNAALLVGTVGYARGNVSSESLLGLGIVAKSVEACLKGIELGYWGCIKTHLGDHLSLQYQRSLNRTIVGMETITQAVAYNAATAATYFAVIGAKQGDSNLNAVMLSLLIGCGVILAGNLHFVQLAKRLDRPAGLPLAV